MKPSTLLRFAGLVTSLVAGLSLETGCRSRLLDELPPDLAGPTCSDHHSLDVTPLSGLTLVDEPSLMGAGRAVRVRAHVSLRAGCDLLGIVDAQVVPLGRVGLTVGLTAHVWHSSRRDADCGAPSVGSRVIVVSEVITGGAPPGPLFVQDLARGSTISVEVMLPPSSTACDETGLGRACAADCQCSVGRPAARCVSRPTGALCAVPCADDADCPTGQRCGEGFVCAGATPCTGDAECPSGWRCDGTACHPSQTTVFDQPCACDAQCGFGGVCKIGVDLGYCQVPCSSSVGCPHAGNRCVDSQCYSGT